MSKICGYSCEHNKSGVCQISVCSKKSHMSDKTEVQTFTRYIDPTITELQQENKQQSEKIGKLKDNWNELREWIIYNKHNENTEQHYLVVDYGTLLGKMQELEQGSDN